MPPRAVWVMLPAGAPTEETVTALGERFRDGDTIIDGGNTFYKDDIRRAARAEAQGHPLCRLSAPRAGCGAPSAAIA